MEERQGEEEQKGIKVKMEKCIWKLKKEIIKEN